jgi:hypothetical protein
MEGKKQDTSGNHEGFLGESSQIPLQYFRRGKTFGGRSQDSWENPQRTIKNTMEKPGSITSENQTGFMKGTRQD